MNSAIKKLSHQNGEVHEMILALEDELSEARSTIVSMENRYGRHAVQMINKWTCTGVGLYEVVILKIMITPIDSICVVLARKNYIIYHMGLVSPSSNDLTMSYMKTGKNLQCCTEKENFPLLDWVQTSYNQNV